VQVENTIFLDKIFYRMCALKYKNGLYDPGYSCPHLEDEPRGHIGTYTKPELEKALEAGFTNSK
jgi:hypothetical protein